MIALLNATATAIPLPDASVHCVVTSPPYWALRDYGLPGRVWSVSTRCKHVWGLDLITDKRGTQLGKATTADARESTRGQFCQRCGAWRGCLGLEPTPEMYVQHIIEVFREIWRVLRNDGTLWLNLGDSYASQGGHSSPGNTAQVTNTKAGHALLGPQTPPPGLKPKDLVGIPWRVALALQADGWWLRSDIIWSKTNAMPESVTDRPTKAHEYVFLLAKSKRYFYDADAVREPSTRQTGQATTFARETKDHRIPNQRAVQHRTDRKHTADTGYRNRRTVWTIPTRPYTGAHFATYPPALVEPCIKAGCPLGGTVLDPFVGSGTTLVVARQLRRNGIGLDLNYNYLSKQARKRLRLDKLAT